MPGGKHMCNELPYTFDAICGHQTLLRKDFLELSVVIICKFKIVRFLDQDSIFLGFSDTSAAGTTHAGEEFVLITGQINFESTIHPILKIEPAQIPHSEVPIHHLVMNAS